MAATILTTENFCPGDSNNSSSSGMVVNHWPQGGRAVYFLLAFATSKIGGLLRMISLGSRFLWRGVLSTQGNILVSHSLNHYPEPDINTFWGLSLSLARGERPWGCSVWRAFPLYM